MWNKDDRLNIQISINISVVCVIVFVDTSDHTNLTDSWMEEG